jgi:NAD(P)H-flavin reductase
MGDRDVVVVAGGIGLAPLFPAIDVLLAQPSARRRIVVYGARRPPERILKTRLSRLRRRADRHDTIELHETVDAPDEHWRGHVGVVTQLLAGLSLSPQRTSALVCGPEIMMRFTADALVALGVDAAQIQVSIERSMKCGIGLCGHCQGGPLLACRDGAVTTYPLVKDLWSIRGL